MNKMLQLIISIIKLQLIFKNSCFQIGIYCSGLLQYFEKIADWHYERNKSAQLNSMSHPNSPMQLKND
eukprot:UN05182